MIIKTNQQVMSLISKIKSAIFVFLLSYNFSVKCLSQDSNKFHPWQLIKDVICFKLIRVRQFVWTNTVAYSLLHFLLMRTTIHEVHQKAHSLGWRKIENVLQSKHFIENKLYFHKPFLVEQK